MEKEKKSYPIRQLWHWYYGNYCVKKCRDDEGLKISVKCCEKMEEFCDKCQNLTMTHREFLELFAKHMNICRFDEFERKRMPSWKEVRSECYTCKKLGIRF